MTLENQNEIKSTFEITRIIIHLYKAKNFVIIFAILGFIFGTIFRQKIEPKYVVDVELEPIATNGDVIAYLLFSINGMDLNTKSRKLNLSKKTASKVLKITTENNNTFKTGDILSMKTKIKYKLYFEDLQSYRAIQKGILYFINSDPHIKNEFKNYLGRRKVRSEILQSINGEIKELQKRFAAKNLFEEYTKKSNADLYRIKLEMEYELSNPAVSFVVNFQGVPTPYSDSFRIFESRIAYTIIGVILGYLVFLFKDNINLITKEVHIIRYQIKKR